MILFLSSLPFPAFSFSFSVAKKKPIGYIRTNTTSIALRFLFPTTYYVCTPLLYDHFFDATTTTMTDAAEGGRRWIHKRREIIKSPAYRINETHRHSRPGHTSISGEGGFGRGRFGYLRLCVRDRSASPPDQVAARPGRDISPHAARPFRGGCRTSPRRFAPARPRRSASSSSSA